MPVTLFHCWPQQPSLISLGRGQIHQLLLRNIPCPLRLHHGEQHTQELQHRHPEHIFYAGLHGLQHNVRDPGDQNVRKKDPFQDPFRPWYSSPPPTPKVEDLLMDSTETVSPLMQSSTLSSPWPLGLPPLLWLSKVEKVPALTCWCGWGWGWWRWWWR